MLKAALTATVMLAFVIIAYYIFAPAWNMYGNALSNSSSNVLSGAYLTDFQGFMVSLNRFFGWAFIVIALIITSYIFIYAWRKEYDTGEL